MYSEAKVMQVEGRTKQTYLFLYILDILFEFVRAFFRRKAFFDSNE